MGYSTRRSLYHAVLILIISIENYILCDSSSEEDSTELLEPVFNVLRHVKNDSPKDKLMNTLLTVAAAKGVLPDVYSATRPMWPQRPPKPTQIQDPKSSSKIQQSQFSPLTSHPTPVLQSPYTVTSSKSPILFPEANQFDPHRNSITQGQNPTQQYNDLDRRLILVDPSQNNFESDNPNILAHSDEPKQTVIILPNNGNNPSSPTFNGPSMKFMLSPEYSNTLPISNFPAVFSGPNPYGPVTQYPILMGIPDNNIMLPSVFPAPISVAPIGSPSNVLPSNGVFPSVEIINPSEINCQSDKLLVTPSEITNDIPEILNSDKYVVQSNPQGKHVPYNLEINLPVLTTIIPSSDSGFLLPETPPQMPSYPVFPPFMEYPPYPFPPLPMPYLPPIVIQGPKSKSKDLLKIFLLSQLLPIGLVRGNNRGCGDCRYIPVPYPIPFSTNDPILIE